MARNCSRIMGQTNGRQRCSGVSAFVLHSSLCENYISRVTHGLIYWPLSGQTAGKSTGSKDYYRHGFKTISGLQSGMCKNRRSAGVIQR